MSEPRVLIVDDNAMNVELVMFVLGAAAFEVESAANARQAIRQITAFRPDLILKDVQMPDIDGIELTRQIKADPATRDITVVAFTAYAMKGDEARMRAAGCDGYISKPIDVTKFAAQIRACLPGKPDTR